MAKTEPDWTRTGTVCGYADYLRTKSDAICVLVIRAHDSVFSVDALCAAQDAEELVRQYITPLAHRVDAAQREKKQAARLEMERCPE